MSDLCVALAGSNPQPLVTGLEDLPGKTNYPIGRGPGEGRTNVPTYAKARYQNSYPGIDLVYSYGAQRQLEYDIGLGPRARSERARAVTWEILDGGAVRERVGAAGEAVEARSNLGDHASLAVSANSRFDSGRTPSDDCPRDITRGHLSEEPQYRFQKDCRRDDLGARSEDGGRRREPVHAE